MASLDVKMMLEVEHGLALKALLAIRKKAADGIMTSEEPRDYLRLVWEAAQQAIDKVKQIDEASLVGPNEVIELRQRLGKANALIVTLRSRIAEVFNELLSEFD